MTSRSPIDPLPNPEATQPRIWTRGTLTYTLGALVVLFCWLLWGDFAGNMKDRAVGPVSQIMLRQLNASDTMVGLLMGSVPAALGLIIGPVIGVKSDRHRGKWGRRIPFLIIPTPITALAIAGIGISPWLGQHAHDWLGANSPAPAILAMYFFIFFWSLFDIGNIIVNGIFGGLINDVVPSEVIGTFFGFFRAVSLVAGILFNFYIIGHADDRYMEILVGVALLYGVGFMLMCFMVKEGSYAPPPHDFPEHNSDVFRSAVVYAKECFTKPYYLCFFAANMFCWAAPTPVNAYSIYYAKSMGISMDAYGKYLVLTFIISFCLSFFLGVLADLLHPLRLTMLSIALYTLAMIWGAIFAKTAATFAIAFVLHGVLSGMFFTSAASLGQRLLPKAKFTQFASAAGLFGAPFGLLMPIVMGKILDASGHAYRLTFIIGTVYGVIGFCGLLVVHSMFMKLGGPKHYVAPE